MRKQKVKITCYGQTQEFDTNKKALDYFIDCFRGCDPESSEAGRYMYIIQKLMDNETEITDENY